MYENVENFTLLGVEFVPHPRLGIKWDQYIQKCIKQAYSNMWILKRLVEKGVPRQDLLMTYQSRIRTHLERNVPLFHFSINNQLTKTIEKIQKACVYIILGKFAKSNYAENLALLNLETMAERREKLCKNFAKKSIRHQVHKQMFTWKKGNQTRTKSKVIIPYARTKRYDTSPIPSLSRMINLF